MKTDAVNFSLAIWSPTSDGASVVTVCFAEYLRKNFAKNITVIDGDTYCPSTDIYLGIDSTPPGIKEQGSGSLNLMGDALNSEQLSLEVYSELVLKYKNNLAVITGNNSLKDWEGIWNADKNSSYFIGKGKDCFTYYDEIFNKAKETSNIILIDTGSNIVSDSTKYFLHNSDYVLVVTGANYVQLLKAQKLLNHCEVNYNLSKEKSFILVNKLGRNSLNNQEIRLILKGWNVLNNTLKADPDLFDNAANKRAIRHCTDAGEKVYKELSEKTGLVIKEKHSKHMKRDREEGYNAFNI